VLVRPGQPRSFALSKGAESAGEVGALVVRRTPGDLCAHRDSARLSVVKEHQPRSALVRARDDRCFAGAQLRSQQRIGLHALDMLEPIGAQNRLTARPLGAAGQRFVEHRARHQHA
jgi:hypothetical protein